MLPATGSTMTPAISCGRAAKAASTASRSLKGSASVCRDLLRDASRAGDAEGGHAGAGLDQQAIGVAVIAALELDDVFAAGEAAREADRRHGRLGAGGDEAQLLDGRQGGDDELGEIGLGAVDAPKLAPCAAACWIASTTGGKAWPRIIGPQEPK